MPWNPKTIKEKATKLITSQAKIKPQTSKNIWKDTNIQINRPMYILKSYSVSLVIKEMQRKMTWLSSADFKTGKD